MSTRVTSIIAASPFLLNSIRATQFRQWATGVLRDFAMRGYVLDKERLKNGSFFNKEYFDNLLAEIREILASERKFYQKISNIYATARDYNVATEHRRGRPLCLPWFREIAKVRATTGGASTSGDGDVMGGDR